MAVNDPPVAVNDSGTTNEDTALVIPVSTLMANDSDVDGGTLSITAVQGAVDGTVSLVAANVGVTASLQYRGRAYFT